MTSAWWNNSLREDAVHNIYMATTEKKKAVPLHAMQALGGEEV
jgi:hypothetical protein